MAEQILEGVKVLDFGWIMVGAVISRHLADHGATVIHVESGTKIDMMRTGQPVKDGIPGLNRCAQFSNWNANKYGITLNLNNPRGIEIAKRLVTLVDVVVENFSAGRMSKWGLGYEELKKVNPDIIMLSAPIHGQTGPYSQQPSTGMQLTAMGGFSHLIGWADGGPRQPFFAYSDTVSPRFGAVAILAALEYRRRTGKGLYLDLSQYEAALQFLAPVLLDYTVNGRIACRRGNRYPYAAPHGAYPCKGSNRWCAIAVFSDGEWENFCKVAGHLEWTRHPKFASQLSRKQNEDELDRLVAEWTINHTAEEVMTLMQQGGVAAGVVQNGEDLNNDPQLQHRHHLRQVNHPEIGAYEIYSLPFRLSKMADEPCVAAPCLGQHNEYVYTKLLGMSDKEFVELMAAGAFD